MALWFSIKMTAFHETWQRSRSLLAIADFWSRLPESDSSWNWSHPTDLCASCTICEIPTLIHTKKQLFLKFTANMHSGIIEIYTNFICNIYTLYLMKQIWTVVPHNRTPNISLRNTSKCTNLHPSTHMYLKFFRFPDKRKKKHRICSAISPIPFQ